MLALGIGNIKIDVRKLKRFLGKTPYTPSNIFLSSGPYLSLVKITTRNPTHHPLHNTYYFKLQIFYHMA